MGRAWEDTCGGKRGIEKRRMQTKKRVLACPSGASEQRLMFITLISLHISI